MSVLYYSAAHNVVVVKAIQWDVVPRIVGLKMLSTDQVAVPATLSNLQAMQVSGYDVPSPLEIDGYDWPIKEPWKPMPHQKTTAAFMALHPHAFCFNDPGTMKTLSCLWAADYLMQRHPETCLNRQLRALIVCPLSCVARVWAQHIYDHFLGRRTCTILHGDPEKRQKLLAQDVDFYIINHDGLRMGCPKTSREPLTGLARDIAERDDICLAIIDEASGYRDHTSWRSRAARRLLGQKEYFWLLTGSPTPQGPLDAYGLARLLGKTGESFTNYRARVMEKDPFKPFKWVPRAGAAKAVAELLRPAIRYNSDFLDLPPCTPEQREVPFSDEQAKAHKTLVRDAVLMVQSGATITAVNEAALRMKLIQVACGEIYDSEHVSHFLNPAPRIAEVKAIIDETPRKVVIFAPLTNALHLLYSKLTHYERAIINGATPRADRDSILLAFGKGNLRVLLADPATMSHGINDLVSASVVVWYAPTDRNELYTQGNKRVHRPGQRYPSKIIQLVSTKTEREIYKRLEAQASMQGLVLKLAEEGRR